MKVTLRERKKNNKISLYLDYYHKGKRKTEYLRLYLDPSPKQMHQQRKLKTKQYKTKILKEASLSEN